MSDGVARYYDRNTQRFLLLGRGRGTYTIHRELWGPGVTSARDAARYIDRVIADEVGDLASQFSGTLVDFGCGVGGTLLYMAERFPGARLHGVTISAEQVEVAKGLTSRAGVADRCSISQGDFHSTDLGVRAAAVVAIESMAHSADIDAFLGNAAGHLASGGALIIADDFLAARPESLDESRRRRVDQLRAGWHLPGLCTVEQVVAEASRHQLSLRKDHDLSGYTRPGSRLRDLFVALSSPVLDRLGLVHVPFFGNIIGGNALQFGLKDGYIRYRLLVFERAAESATPETASG